MASPSLLFFCFAFMTVTATQQTVDAAATNTTSQSARNSSSLAFPLFSVRTTNASSSFLLKALKAASPEAAAVAAKASFVYDDVTLMTEVMVGTPPQKQKMVLDTGSELSWLLCKSGSPSSFKPTISATHSAVPCRSSVCTAQTKDFPLPTSCDAKRLCHFTYTYADGTNIDGTLARDSLSLPSLKIPAFVFGCSSAPVPSTPGLMGLNRGALSFISQLTATHKFSYCISDRPGSAGVLVLGESPLGKYLHYTPLLTISLPLPYFNRAAYSVRLEGIRVGNKLLPIPKSVFLPDHTGAGQTMIDSGTQFTFLLGEAYAPLKQEFVQQNRGLITPMAGDFVYQGALDLCYHLPAAAALFPRVSPVTLLFNSAQITLESRQLLYPVPKSSAPPSNGRAIFCFTFGNSDLVPVEANIIGNHHQQNLWIEYDIPNSRIGFARARCSKN